MQLNLSEDRNTSKSPVLLKYEVNGLGLSEEFYMPAEVSKQFGAYIFRVVSLRLPMKCKHKASPEI